MVPTKYLIPLGLSIASILCLSPSAHAHPGHAFPVEPPDSSLHYLAQPEHAAVFLVFALTIALLWKPLLSHARREF